MKKHIIKDLSLSEISGVTIPAQSHALVSIMKSEHIELAKYLSTDYGAKSFEAFMADEVKQKQKNKIYELLWGPMDALRNSIISIKLDASLNDEQRSVRISEAVAQFDEVVKGVTSQRPELGVISPNELLKVFEQQESNNMSEELVKKAEGLEAQVAELIKSLEEATLLSKMSDDEKEYLASLNDAAKADEFRAASSADRAKLMRKSAEADEVFKSVDGMEIRKSAVGPAFDILKAQDEALRVTRAELAKQADRAQTVELTKRAEDELANLPGETVSKVAVLKMVAGADEATRDALTAMLKAGNEALAKGYQSFGVSGGKPQDITKAAKRDELIKAHMAVNPNVTKAVAEVAVISAHPELYEG